MLTLRLDDIDKEDLKTAKYDNGVMEFSPASTVRNGAVEPLRGFYSCREVVCNEIRNSINTDSPLPRDRCRFLVYRRRPGCIISRIPIRRFRKDIAAGVKLLNIFEKEAKWPLTKAYEVKHDLSKAHMFFYLVGSRRWIKAIPLTSLFLILVRLGAGLSKAPNFRTIFGARKAFDAVCSVDIDRFIKYNSDWLIIMKNYRRLFGNRTLEDLYWPEDKEGDGYFNDGIDKLCTRSSMDNKLSETLDKIYKEMKQ
jgi:hypothetical protein